MKIGLLAYASPTGLGIQTQNYYKFLQPHKTMVIDLSSMNHFPVDNTIFTDNPIGTLQFVKGFPQSYEINEFCNDLDVILFAETPLNPYLITRARQQGIKTVLHLNFEFLDYLNQPQLPKPDLLLAPSFWHYDELQHHAHNWGVALDYLPVPVDSSVLPFTQRTSVTHFLHIAGHATAEDRNGTEIVHAAIKLVRNKNVRFTIRAQRKVTTLPSDKRVTVIVDDVKDYADLYGDADCLLMPRRYGGLCLPLNEAASLGMLPLMPNVSPQTGILPSELLMPTSLARILQTRTPIGVYDTSPQILAAYIDHLATLDSAKVRALSNEMHEYAASIDWNNPELMELYQYMFTRVINDSYYATTSTLPQHKRAMSGLAN